MPAKPQTLSQSAAQRFTYFDLLAVLCHAIRSQPETRQEAAYRAFTGSYAEYYKRVRVQFPFLSADYSPSAVHYYDLKPEQAKQMLGVLDSAESDQDWAVILAAVEAIDQLLELAGNMEKFLVNKNCPVKPLEPDGQGNDRVSQYYYHFDALNPATKKYGLLLPQESCRWQRPGSRSMDSVAFNPLSGMKNYLWVRPDTGYEIVNLYSDFKLSPERRLKVVTSPLSSQAPFLLHCRRKNRTFEIEYLSESVPAIDARFQKAMGIAVDEQADIAMFPEMMASRESIRSCAEYIQVNWQQKYPSLILLPTCEYAGEKGWVNELTALDSDGCCIFTYHKKHPFRLEKKSRGKGPGGAVCSNFFYEPIQGDDVIYILHVPGIGRIGFLICSDVFRDGYLDCLTRELKVTLLLHAVYSPGEDLLDRKLTTAKRDMCDVVVCNTCAAWDKVGKKLEKRPYVKISDKRMVNIYYPYGHKYNEPQPPPVTCTQRECTGCAFVIEAADKYSGRAVAVNHRYE